MTDRGDPDGSYRIRHAALDEAGEVARLLHDFNTEFDTPSPGIDVLTRRLEVLLRAPGTVAILAGKPAVAVALVTLRPNVWFDGPVGLLDELYVVPQFRSRGIGSAIMDELHSRTHELGVELIEINVDEGDTDAQRFYEHLGYSSVESSTNERAFYYFREFVD